MNNRIVIKSIWYSFMLHDVFESVCIQQNLVNLSVCVYVCMYVCVCFRELVKLFCTESSHRKELMPFLTGLITSLSVSDIWSVQTLITNPHPRSRSSCHSLFFLSHLHALPPPPQSVARTNRLVLPEGVPFTLHGNLRSSLWSSAAAETMWSEELKG